MSSWKERIERIRKELGIRDEEWFEIIDKLTIMDELNILLLYEIRQLRNEIRGLRGLPPVTIRPPTAPPTPVELPKIMKTLDAALVPIKYGKVDVTDTSDETYDLKDETEVVMITTYKADVRISLAGNTSDETPPFPDGSIWIFTRAKGIRRIWFRAVSGSGEVYISEYKIGK